MLKSFKAGIYTRRNRVPPQCCRCVHKYQPPTYLRCAACLRDASQQASGFEPETKSRSVNHAA